MTTGAELAVFTLKKLAGFADFDTLLLKYLQTSVTESVKRVFREGSFSEVMLLSGPGADQVRIELKAGLNDGIVHDGAGHILDIEALVTRTMPFANVNTIDYEVGAKYVEAPSGIAVNPRTGLPEYVKKIEAIGTEADPNSVVNNGADLTIVVDSLFEAGVAVSDQAGRFVRVFKKVPASGALTEPVAIETVEIVFNGGANEITTASLLGQSTVSTTPADYTVQLVGPIVYKATATNKPSTDDDAWFCGVVTGNAGVPAVFDTSGQTIVQADLANEVVVIPFVGPAPISWDIAAIDVQAAFAEIVADLSAKNSGTNGANLLGVNLADFTTSVIGSGDAGGVGVGGNPDEPDSAQDAIKNLDRRVVARRPFTAVMADGTARTIADFVGADAIDQVDAIGNGGRFLLHADGGSDYEFSAETGFGGDAEYPTVEGEVSVSGHDGYPTVAIPDGATVDHILRGHFKRLHFKSNDVTATTRGFQIGSSATVGGVVMEDCGVDAGHAIIRGFAGDANPQNAIYIRNTEFAPGSAAGPFETALSLIESLGNDTHVIFDNCLIRGPHSAAAGATAVLEINGFTAGKFAGITFRDCQIVHENDTSIPTVKITQIGSGSAVNFIRTSILGIADQDEAVLDVTNARVNVDGLRINAPGGRAVRGGNMYGDWRNVWLRTTASARSVAFVTNQVFTVTPTDGPFIVDNIFIELGVPVFATAPVAPYVEFGGVGGVKTGNANYAVSNLFIEGKVSGLNGSAVGFWSRNTVRACQVDNVVVDLTNGGWKATTLVAGANLVKTAIIEFVNNDDDIPIYGSNIQVYNLDRDTTDEVAAVGIYNQGCHLKGVSVLVEAGGTADIQAALYTNDDGGTGKKTAALVDGFVLVGPSSATSFLTAPIVMAGEGDKIINVDFTKYITAPPGGAVGMIKMTAAAADGMQEADGLYWGDINAGALVALVDLGAGQFNQLKNFRIDQGGLNRTAAMVIGTGKGQRVGQCMLRSEGATLATYVSLTGAVSMVHNNTLLSIDATPPTITNSGTGSISPDNILAANQ